MPSINDYFPSQGSWLKVEDLNNRAIKATVERIERIEVPDFNDKEKKHKAFEIFFVGAEKSFVCKVMNARSIAATLGEDWTTWIGKKIILKPGVSSNGNKMIVAEGEVEVSEGFGSTLEKQLDEVQKEFGGSRIPDDDSVPF